MALPWLLDRGRDPALGSGPLATVIQDRLSTVIYLAGVQPGWDQPASWFGATGEGYPSTVLSAWQHARTGRSPVTLPRSTPCSSRIC